MSSNIQTIGILGAGKVGTGVARQAVEAGYRVLIAASGDPAQIDLIVSVMAPGAQAMTAAQVMADSDLIVLSVPLHKFRTLDAGALSGKRVIDTMNYWYETDGTMPELAQAPSSSEMVNAHLDGSVLAKTLNHIGYHDLELDGRPAGAAERRALAVVADDAEMRQMVMEFVDRLGYDAVDAGPLAAGTAFEPGTPIFTGSYTRAEMLDQLENCARELQPAGA